VTPGYVLAIGDSVAPAFGGQPGDGVDDVAHRRPHALLGERRHRPVGDAAGDDVLAQVRHVGGDVEGEAVHRAAVLQPYADRGDLSWLPRVRIDPHARILRQSPGGDPERGEGVDQELFDVADVLGRTETVAHVDDRIADELAGAVVRDVAAPPDPDEVGTDGCRVAVQVVGEVRPRSVGEHVRVLEQEEVLLTAAVEEGLLHRQRLPVRDGAEPPDVQPCCHSSADQSLVSRSSFVRLRKPAAYAPSNAR
jgi:hypothetical protein